MSATERLRELLDERGIEWSDRSLHPDRQYITDWSYGGFLIAAVESHDGKLELLSDYHCLITPEQVIEVTLGRGDVRDEAFFMRLSNGFECDGSVWRCCKCGAFFTNYTDLTDYHKPRFCPNCGAKVVD